MWNSCRCNHAVNLRFCRSFPLPQVTITASPCEDRCGRCGTAVTQPQEPHGLSSTSCFAGPFMGNASAVQVAWMQQDGTGFHISLHNDYGYEISLSVSRFVLEADFAKHPGQGVRAFHCSYPAFHMPPRDSMGLVNGAHLPRHPYADLLREQSRKGCAAVVR